MVVVDNEREREDSCDIKDFEENLSNGAHMVYLSEEEHHSAISSSH